MKRFLSVVLSLAMMATMSTAAFAADTEQRTQNQIYANDDGYNQGISDLTVEVVKAASPLIATVPVELPIIIDTKGNVTVPTDAKIINNSDFSIKVNKATIALDKSLGWSIRGIAHGSYVDWDEEKWLEISINGSSSCTLGEKFTTKSGNIGYYDVSTSVAGSPIEKDGELPLTFNVTKSNPIWKTEMTKTKVGTISFTISKA